MERPEAEQELNSWKAIGDYLGVSGRTAQKWESTSGLPVHRLPGEKGRVFAVPVELDRWKTAHAERKARWKWWNDLTTLRFCAAAATIVAVLAIGFAGAEHFALSRHGRPVAFRTEFSTLAVLDSGGRELWTHTFDEPFLVNAYAGYEGQYRVWFGDIDGDSAIETLFVYYPAQAETAGTSLLCFSEKGALKWKFAPQTTISDAGGRSYPPPYVLSAFAVVDFPKPLGRRIAVTSRHSSFYPNHFALLDGHGKLLGEYWHSGHQDYMAFIDLDGDGVQEILLAGVNNGYKQATLVALDPRDFTGASYQGEGSPYQIRGYPLHKEKAVRLFPRTCINRKFEMYNMARAIVRSGDSIRVTVVERDMEGVVVVYLLDRGLRVRDVVPGDGLRSAHRRLEGEGTLDHPFTEAEARELRNVTLISR